MGFLSDLFSGIEDVGRGDLGMFDDMGRGDFSGAEDRMDGNLMTIMENDSLRTVGLPIADFFSFGMASPAARAKYNKLKYGKSGMEWGDLAKSMAGNYVANEFLPGTSTNTLGDVAYNTAAGAGRGAISSGIQGESMTTGAQAGAVQGGLTSGGSYLGSMFQAQPASYVPTDRRQGMYNEITQSSSAPQGERADYFSPEGSTAPQQSEASPYVAQGSPMAYNAKPAEEASLGSQFTDFISSLMPNSPSRFGDVSQGLLGMYSGMRRRRAAKELMGGIGANRGAYETQLRNNLARRDAASGKRSNYAGREVELQSALAQLDSRNAPALSQLNNERFSGLDTMLRSSLQMGGNLGWFGPQYQRSDPALTPLPSVRPLPTMPEMPMSTGLSLNEMSSIPRMPRRYGASGAHLGGWQY